MNNKIIDIIYQQVYGSDEESIKKETKRLIKKGYQPFYAPVFSTYETTFKVHYGMWQAWVKYES